MVLYMHQHHKMSNIFTHNPIRIHQLHPYNDNVNTWIFVGRYLPKDVLKDLKKIESDGLTDKLKQSTTLKKFYGAKWQILFQNPLDSKKKYGSKETEDTRSHSTSNHSLNEPNLESTPIDENFDLSSLEAHEDRMSDYGFAQEAAELGKIEFSLEDISKANQITKLDEDTYSGIPAELQSEDISSVISKQSSTERKQKHVIHIVTEDISLYPEDSVLDIKKKLYVVSGIPIFRQHLWINFISGKSLPLHYTVMTSKMIANQQSDMIFPNMKKILNIIHLSANTRNNTTTRYKESIIQNIPVNMRAFAMKNEIKIEALDEFKLLQHYYYSYGATEYFMVDLNSFEINSDLLKKDRYQLELIYYGFVMLYYPMMTLPVFVQWITSPNEIRSYYPDLLPSKHQLTEQYKIEQEIIDTRYLLESLIASSPSAPSFSRCARGGQAGPRSRDLRSPRLKSAPVLESAITYSVVAVTNYAYNENAIHIRNLFDYFALDKIVDACKCIIGQSHLSRGLKGGEATAIGIGEKYVILNKTYENSLLISDEIPINSIMFRLNLKSSRHVHILILNNGSYRIFSRWREEDRYDFTDILNIMKISLGEFIERINLGGSLTSDVKLSLPNHTNSRFTEINISMFYKKSLTETEFASLQSRADYFAKAGIMIKAIQEKTYASSADYYFYKGMFQYDLKRLEHSLKILNSYEFLSEAIVKQKWDALFAKTRSTKLIHRLSDVKIEITGVREQEFETYFWFITTLFYMFEKISVTAERAKIKGELSSHQPKNYVQYLKSFDPALYNFKKKSRDIEKGRKKSLEAVIKTTKILLNKTEQSSKKDKQDKNIYSKLCQRPFQPKILTSEEYDNLTEEDKKRVVNYWNFTTQSEAYYVCPNKKYPNLRFIVKKHPLDYCIPCCKKREMSTSSNIQTTCLEEHIYTQEKKNIAVMSRYIMTYGKNIEPGRISHLPKNNLEPLFYESSTSHTSESGCGTATGFYIYGSPQHSQNASNIGYLFSLSHALNASLDDLIEKTIVHIRKHPEKFSILLQGLIFQFFKNTVEFEKDLWSLTHKSKSLLITKDAPWNRIFIDIARIFFNVNTIHFIDIGEGGEIKLNIPGSLKNSDEYILPTHKNLIVIQKDEYYYPIYYLNTEMYFAAKIIDTKLFSNNSNIIYIISDLIHKIFLHHLKMRSGEFNLDNLYKFVNNPQHFKKHKYTTRIVKCHINKSNLCYGVILACAKCASDSSLLEHPSVQMYIPLEESRYEIMQNIPLDFEPITSNTNKNITFNMIQKFIEMYNEWVEHNNRQLHDQTESIQLHPLKIESWLLLHKLQSDKNATKIGFVANGLFFYCKISISEQLATKITSHKRSLLVDPFEINQVVYNMPLPLANSTEKSSNENVILHKLFLYQLLLLEFMTYFNAKKNKHARKQIKRILSRLVSSDTRHKHTNRVDYDSIIEQLASVIDYQQDLAKIKNILYEYIEESQLVHSEKTSKMKVREFFIRFDNTRFDFDNEKMNQLKKTVDHVELKAKLKKIAHKFVSFTSAKNGIKVENNMYTSCQAKQGKQKQSQCNKKRLMMNKHIFDEYIDILAADLRNPIKSQWIFNEILLKRNFHFYRFIKRPKEQITIVMAESAYIRQ